MPGLEPGFLGRVVPSLASVQIKILAQYFIVFHFNLILIKLEYCIQQYPLM
jgi:hypothetical protein